MIMRHVNEPIETQVADATVWNPASGEANPTSVFADPVSYLEQFGIAAELVETRTGDLPAAA